MHPLARSFSEFLDILVEIHVPYCRIEDLGRTGTPAELAKYLAEGKSLDALGKNNRSILCEAIRFNNVPMIDACLERKASLSNAVLTAVYNRRVELIPTLIAAGADVNEKDEHGYTPLGHVGGSRVPGVRGEENRKLRDVLIALGAHEQPGE